MTNIPTDAELISFAVETGMRVRTGKGVVSFARAVLARWGQPAHSGEPVAWLSPWRADQVTTDYDAYGEHGIALYTAPQSSPAAQGGVLDAEVLRDAERYRFIRDVPYSDDVRSVLVHQQNAAMDRVIDAARAAREGKSHE